MTPSPQRCDPRYSVVIYSEAMERVLRKNDHKDGWSEMSLGEIFDRIQEEMDEAEKAWNSVKKREQYEKVSEELIDVANFCMMFYDNLHPQLSICASHNPATERKEFLGKIVLRIRQEFTQDDQEEWYLSAEDFENVLDEFNQEIEDDAEPHSKEEQG